MKLSTITAAIITAAIKAKASPEPYQDCWIVPFNDTPWPIAFVFNPKTQESVIINVRTKNEIKLNGSPASETMKNDLMDQISPKVGKNWLKQNPSIAKKLEAATELTESLMSDVIKSIQASIHSRYTVAAGRITVPGSLATVAKKAAPAEAVDPNIPTEALEGYFVLGYWANPYNDSKEYFWNGPYEDRVSAASFGKRKQQRGQPTRFVDWVKGSNTIIQGWPKFKAAAQKVGLNPSDSEINYYRD